MAKITKIDKETCKSIRDLLTEVLKAAHPDLEFKIGNMRYGGDVVEIKLDAKLKGGQSRSESNAERFRKLSGYKQTSRNGKYTIVGFDARKHKYSWELIGPGGKTYRASTSQMDDIFDKEAA